MCTEWGLLAKTQKEWPFIKTVGFSRQIRIPVENCLPHVLDDTFREDRSSAKKSKNNLALIRKFAYNILRIAMLNGDCSKIMTEAMDDFSDDLELGKKYVFNGINSFY